MIPAPLLRRGGRELPLWGLHPQRAEVLSAVALAMGGGEALPEALSRLCAGDPLLAPWGTRLGNDLRQGRSLAEVLRDHRLISRPEAESLAADPVQVAAIGRLARDHLSPVRGLLLVRWFPVWIAVAVSVVPACYCTMLELIGMGPRTIAGEMGVRAPSMWWMQIDDLRFPFLLWPFLALILPLVLYGVVAGMRRIPLFGIPFRLWCLEVDRLDALRQVIRAARSGTDPDQVQMLWERWWWVMRWRFAPAERTAIAASEGLMDRLVKTGLLPSHPDASALEQAEAMVSTQLQRAVDGRGWLMWSVLLCMAMITCLTSGFSTLIQLMQSLGGG